MNSQATSLTSDGRISDVVPRLVNSFLRSAGVLLIITALAKLISGLGSANVLDHNDPIFQITFRTLFLLVGSVELLAGFFCVFARNFGWRAGLIALLATNFLGYRLSLFWMGYHKPCNCLGSFTDAIHVSPETADVAMKVVLLYLLLGSYLSLFWLWKRRRT